MNWQCIEYKTIVTSVDDPTVYVTTYYDKYFKLHRIDGPAIEYPSGKKEWYIDGKNYTEEEYNRVLKLLFLI